MQSMSILEFARLVIDALQAAHVEYLLGGSLALVAWGEPRSTLDVDLVISLPGNRIKELSWELEKRQMLVPRKSCLTCSFNRKAIFPSMRSIWIADTRQSYSC